jgi:RNA polymerase sigma factor (sigma-70 family)
VNRNVTGVLGNRAGCELVKRAQKGDADAFATLFDAHKMRIYSLCLRMTNNVAEAEDLTQDSFLQVFRKLNTFRGESALSTWLYRIAVNTVLMHFRRKSPCRISLDESHDNQGDTKPVRREYGSRDGHLETSVTRIALARAIGELPMLGWNVEVTTSQSQATNTGSPDPGGPAATLRYARYSGEVKSA